MKPKKKGFSITFLNILILFIDFVLKWYNLTILTKIKKILLSYRADVIFVIEDGNWAIAWVGKYITESLKKLKLINTELSTHYFATNKIIHFGSINCLINPYGLIELKESNKNIVTWFHILPEDKRLKIVPFLNKKVDFLHTPSNFTKRKLIESGFDDKKIVVIPLGVDLSQFKKYNEKCKTLLRKKYNLPTDKIIIGSFQKDGVGWGEGLEPKLIKGPDVFCEVVKEIQEKFDIHIFLTGPARGYIKKKLEEYHVPYTHIFLENYLDIVECYNSLDLYLVTSRAEGGPNALLEGMATGVPIVTTNVGMAADLVKQGINGFITDIEDIDQLYQFSYEVLKNKELKKELIRNGIKTVQKYNWEYVAKQYYQKIYSKLLD